jgi:predicted RNase H-like HicB family nuclease
VLEGDAVGAWRTLRGHEEQAPAGGFSSRRVESRGWAIMDGEESSMRLVVTLERDETGMIVAECPAIPGCVSQGRTEDEAIANIREAIAACVEARAASGMPVTVAIREVEVAV